MCPSCSQNAHDETVLVRCAQERAALATSLREMTRIERPSPGLTARPGKSIAKQSEGWVGEKYLPVGGRVRKLRAVEDQSAPIPEELGRMEKECQVPFLLAE